MPKLGEQMMYRPVPADFPETFTRLGWGRIERHYRANWRTVKRWIDVCGREGLTKARRDYVSKNGYNRRCYGD